MTVEHQVADCFNVEVEPFFDIVDVPFLRHDLWARFFRACGVNLTRQIPQLVWRPGGQERFAAMVESGNRQLSSYAAANRHAQETQS